MVRGTPVCAPPVPTHARSVPGREQLREARRLRALEGARDGELRADLRRHAVLHVARADAGEGVRLKVGYLVTWVYILVKSFPSLTQIPVTLRMMDKLTQLFHEYNPFLHS